MAVTTSSFLSNTRDYNHWNQDHDSNDENDDIIGESQSYLGYENDKDTLLRKRPNGSVNCNGATHFDSKDKANRSNSSYSHRHSNSHRQFRNYRLYSDGVRKHPRRGSYLETDDEYETTTESRLNHRKRYDNHSRSNHYETSDFQRWPTRRRDDGRASYVRKRFKYSLDEHKGRPHYPNYNEIGIKDNELLSHKSQHYNNFNVSQNERKDFGNTLDRDQANASLSTPRVSRHASTLNDDKYAKQRVNTQEKILPPERDNVTIISFKKNHHNNQQLHPKSSRINTHYPYGSSNFNHASKTFHNRSSYDTKHYKYKTDNCRASTKPLIPDDDSITRYEHQQPSKVINHDLKNAKAEDKSSELRLVVKKNSNRVPDKKIDEGPKEEGEVGEEIQYAETEEEEGEIVSDHSLFSSEDETSLGNRNTLKAQDDNKIILNMNKSKSPSGALPYSHSLLKSRWEPASSCKDNHIQDMNNCRKIEKASSIKKPIKNDSIHYSNPADVSRTIVEGQRFEEKMDENEEGLVEGVKHACVQTCTNYNRTKTCTAENQRIKDIFECNKLNVDARTKHLQPLHHSDIRTADNNDDHSSNYTRNKFLRRNQEKQKTSGKEDSQYTIVSNSSNSESDWVQQKPHLDVEKVLRSESDVRESPYVSTSSSDKVVSPEPTTAPKCQDGTRQDKAWREGSTRSLNDMISEQSSKIMEGEKKGKLRLRISVPKQSLPSNFSPYLPIPTEESLTIPPKDGSNKSSSPVLHHSEINSHPLSKGNNDKLEICDKEIIIPFHHKYQQHESKNETACDIDLNSHHSLDDLLDSLEEKKENVKSFSSSFDDDSSISCSSSSNKVDDEDGGSLNSSSLSTSTNNNSVDDSKSSDLLSFTSHLKCITNKQPQETTSSKTKKKPENSANLIDPEASLSKIKNIPIRSSLPKKKRFIKSMQEYTDLKTNCEVHNAIHNILPTDPLIHKLKQATSNVQSNSISHPKFKETKAMIANTYMVKMEKNPFSSSSSSSSSSFMSSSDDESSATTSVENDDSSCSSFSSGKEFEDEEMFQRENINLTNQREKSKNESSKSFVRNKVDRLKLNNNNNNKNVILNKSTPQIQSQSHENTLEAIVNSSVRAREEKLNVKMNSKLEIREQNERRENEMEKFRIVDSSKLLGLHKNKLTKKLFSKVKSEPTGVNRFRVNKTTNSLSNPTESNIVPRFKIVPNLQPRDATNHKRNISKKKIHNPSKDGLQHQKLFVRPDKNVTPRYKTVPPKKQEDVVPRFKLPIAKADTKIVPRFKLPIESNAKKSGAKAGNQKRTSKKQVTSGQKKKEPKTKKKEWSESSEEDSSSTITNQHWVRRSVRQPCKSDLNNPHVKMLLVKLRNNDSEMQVLKLKKYIGPDTPQIVMQAVLDGLMENNNCQALYIQNFNEGMRDKQMLRLLDVLKHRTNIWCINIGETYKVKPRTWEKFTRGLKKTNVTHLYASEHTISAELKVKMRDIIRKNRKKHNLHIDPNNLDVIIQCTHCWWNPINAKCLRPYLQAAGKEHLLFDRDFLGLPSLNEKQELVNNPPT